MRALDPLIRAVTGRRTKWLVVVLWLAAVAATSGYAGKLQSVENNEASSYLPAGVESTRVLNLSRRFSDSKLLPAIVVYRDRGGLDAADRALIARQRDAIAGLASPSILDPSQLEPAPDGQAALFSVPLRVGNNTDRIINDVRALRRVVNGRGNLEAAVTGPAGISADAIDVFGDIDTKLLLATVLLVAGLLLVTYRSPFLWLVPLITVGLAHQVVNAVAYGLAKAGVLINGQTAGILTVLVFGAGTDYALLLVARYREELRRHEDKHEAMAAALRKAAPAILASASTVIAGLLCLLVAVENSVSGFGPVSAVGIALTLAAGLTLLPALLVALPRGVFWPFVPRYGSEPRELTGVWGRIAAAIMRRPRPVWAVCVGALVILALGIFRIDTTTNQLNSFRVATEAVRGQRIIAGAFPGGVSAPADIVVRDPARLDAVRAAAAQTPGIASLGPPQRTDGLARFDAILAGNPYAARAFTTIERLRDRVHAVPGAGALVGGETAVQLDSRTAAVRDIRYVMPLVLFIVLVILGILLRAVVAPVVLAFTVVLSFAATLGVSVIVFRYLFGFDGIEPSLPLLAFIFLVALGVDYNIFLMARVREEAQQVGTRAGMQRGLAVTGGVITSAGVILAGTFSVLGVLPLVALTEVGFLVAFGVLLDTIVVRSVLVPALTEELGARMWWPSALSRRPEPETAAAGPTAIAPAVPRR